MCGVDGALEALLVAGWEVHEVDGDTVLLLPSSVVFDFENVIFVTCIR